MTVVQIIRKFCETTTIRGIGRAIRAENKFLCAVWALSVLFCASFLVYQLSLLFTRFFRYDYQIVDREATSRPTFPDITFCNINPLSVSQQTKTWDQYQAFVTDQQSRLTIDALDAAIPQYFTPDSYNMLWIDLMSPMAYFANFPVLKNMNLNRSDSKYANFTQSIVDINVLDWSWTTDQGSTKYASENIRMIWNPNYYQCYTLQVPSTETENIRSISVIVYVNDFNASIVDKIEANPRRSMSTGIRLAVHERDSMPDLSTGLSAGPGTDTSITVTPLYRKRLTEPYHGCHKNEQVDNETYSLSECIEQCLQERVIANCGCVSGDLLFSTEQFTRVNYSTCRNQTWLEYNDTSTNQTFSKEVKAIRRLLCFYAVPFDFNKCIDQCGPPCSELEYFTSETHSRPWPHPSYQLAFYRQYIKEHAYETRFGDYAAIYLDWKNKAINEADAINKLRNLELIGSNFLQVNVLMDDYVYTTLNEVPSMPNEVLLSNVGGVLSLWLGVTVMTLVEMTEVLYFILVRCYDKLFRLTTPQTQN